MCNIQTTCCLLKRSQSYSQAFSTAMFGWKLLRLPLETPLFVRVLQHSYKANWTPPPLPPNLLWPKGGGARTFLTTNPTHKDKGMAKIELTEAERDVIDLEKVESAMLAAVNSLKREYTSITSRITPSSLERITVNVGDQAYPLKTISQMGMPNRNSIVINMAAYPESMNAVMSAIRASNLNLNPQVEKNVIRVPIPQPTAELTEKLLKLVKQHTERARVSLRRASQKGKSELSKKKASVSEDTVYRLERYLDQMVKLHSASIEKLHNTKATSLKDQ